MQFHPYDRDFDPHALDPFEALKQAIADEGRNRVVGRAGALAAVRGAAKGQAVMLDGCPRDILAEVLNELQPRALWLKSRDLEDLSPLRGAQNLVELVLSDAPRLTNMDGLSALPELRALVVEDCSRLVDLEALERVQGLEMLRLSGPSISGGAKLVNIEPLRALKDLRHLSLGGIRTGDGDLSAIAGFGGLETLQIADTWPARELARLAASYPHLVRRSTFLKPLIASAKWSGGAFFDVDPDAYPEDTLEFMATGARQPKSLRLPVDADRIAKLRKQWDGWVTAFQK